MAGRVCAGVHKNESETETEREVAAVRTGWKQEELHSEMGSHLQVLLLCSSPFLQGGY